MGVQAYSTAKMDYALCEQDGLCTLQTIILETDLFDIFF